VGRASALEMLRTQGGERAERRGDTDAERVGGEVEAREHRCTGDGEAPLGSPDMVARSCHAQSASGPQLDGAKPRHSACIPAPSSRRHRQHGPTHVGRRQEGHEEEESAAAHVGRRLVMGSRLPLRAACACLLHHQKWEEA
jgi:hypothetical protein